MQDKPESLSQAREFDKTRNHYRRLGLCTRCAPQAAYGHADGFTSVRPPCPECAGVVTAMPQKEAGHWRSHGRRMGRAVPQNCTSAMLPLGNEGGGGGAATADTSSVPSTLKTPLQLYNP